MEEERKIEKWLRACAKKRRAQAGESFEIHPATRRLLQGEIARNMPARDGDDKSGSPMLWEILRRRWAFLLSFAFCVLLVAVIIFQFAGTAKRREQALASIAQLKQRNLSANAVGPAIIARSGIRAAPTTAPAVESPPPPPVAGAGPSGAPAQVLAENEKSDRFTPAPAAPPAEMPNAGENMAAFSANKNEQFANSLATRRPESMEPENAFKNNIAPSQSLPILASFQVQQNGNALRIIDQDGSVYEGSLQSLTAASANREQQAPPRQYQAMQNAVGVVAGIPSPPVGQAQNAIRAIRNYFFRVTGTNRTLGQNVTCTGYLVANSPRTTNALQSWGTLGAPAGGFGGFGGAAASDEIRAKSPATNQLEQLPWSSFRISGSAIVNNTNRIQINATPVGTAKDGNRI